MGWTIGIPSLKLNNNGRKSKHCGSFSGVAMEALQERKGRDPDIDPSRSHLNIYEGYQTAAELIEYSRKHVQEISEAQQAAGGRKVRDDAVVMCSTIIKPPAEMMAAMSMEDQLRFLRDAEELLDEIIGPGNVRATAIHFDEQGAHLHKLWEPITEDGRLCAKELHNINFFGRLNREMPEHLRSRGWDIDDCQAYDAAKEELQDNEDRRRQMKENGRSSSVFKRDMERKAARMQAEMDTMKEKLNTAEAALIVAEASEADARRQAEEARKAAQEAQEQARRAMQEADQARQIVQENAGLIQEQEDVLQLIQDYDTYLQEAQSINQDMDLLETAAKELPPATKIFQASAAAAWMQRVEQILQDLRRLIAAGIRRLLIYERSHGVEDRLSEPAQRRAAALDVQIFGAALRAGRGHQEAEKGHIQER